MQLHWAVLLCVSFIVGTQGNPIISTPNLRTTTQRFLKTAYPTQVNEERTITSAFSKVLDEVGYSMLLKSGATPTSLIKGVHVAKTGIKLASEKTFLQWLEFVKKYRVTFGDHTFGNNNLLDALQQMVPNEEQLLLLLQTLRKTPDMETSANTMINFLFVRSSSTRKMMNTQWLNAAEDPKVVFKILSLDDVALYKDKLSLAQWFDYVVKFRAQQGENSFSDDQAFALLMSTTIRPTRSDDELAVLFQSLKATEGLENFAAKMQSRVFENWIKSEVDPATIAYGLKNLPETYFSPDLTFKTVEAYTLQFAQKQPKKALEAAMVAL